MDSGAFTRAGADRAVILSPHFDDAVLSCWSVLSGSREVEVVNVFTGVPGPGADLHEGERLTGARDVVARARERADEDRAALALAGARVRNLDLLEHPHWVAGRRPQRRPWRRLARGPFAGPDEAGRRLRELLDARAAEVDAAARVYAPAALGGHPDHVVVRELACRLLRDGVEVSFYADQPYCYAYGWPHWVVGEEPDPYLDVARLWRRDLDTASVSFDGLHADVVRLDRDHADKVRALRLYRTQFPVLEGGANRRVSDPALTGWEVFWHGQAGRGSERRR
jgi:LmbE family N-acetylglucosaminyl deacetylase